MIVTYRTRLTGLLLIRNTNVKEANMSAESYLSRGVSPTKDDVKAAVKNQDKGVFPGAFAKLIPDIAGDPDYCTAIHADGAGTKSSVAYLMFKETGNYDWFKGLAQDSLVMNTDDLACVGAYKNMSLSNTIGRNAHRVDGKAIAKIIEGYDEMIGKLADLGINITMCGGETADVGDLVRTLIVDSTIVARAKRKDIVNAANIKPGDIIVGLASFGQASYETSYNSGISSNGLTAARHMLLSKYYYENYKESFSETVGEDKAYCGKFRLTDELPGSSQTVGEAILSPTRTFLPVIAGVLDKFRGSINGIIHCTGGGQAKCKDFGKGIRYVKDNLFELPPIFKAIYGSGEIPMKEMFQVFNCGHRIEFYCDSEEAAEGIIAIAGSFNIDARIVGHTESTGTDSNEVVIRYNDEEFRY